MSGMLKYQFPGEDLFVSGHTACPGCGEAQAVRFILRALGEKTILVVPPSCIAIIVGPQPLSSMKVPVYQPAFETSAVAAAAISRALKAKGQDDVTVVALAGDGGTYDIGFQALSAAAERNEDIIYICLDNEGYMNTGVQKSSATPSGAWTTSTPLGKSQPKKNLVEIMAAHGIPYTATATVGYPDDLVRKVQKAKGIRGMRFIEVLTPCISGWGIEDHVSVPLSRLAVESKIFPLYEIEDGERYTLNKQPRGLPVSAYLEKQKRYAHLTGEHVGKIQRKVDKNWERLAVRLQQ